MNTTPFTSKNIEVRFPLKNEVVIAFAQSEEYSFLTDDLYNAYENEACTHAHCDLILSFDMSEDNVSFVLETVCSYSNGDIDSTGTPVDFDPVTAEYFRTEAMKQILKDFNDMAKCRHKQLAQTV